MDLYEIEKKLTPEAKRILEDLVEEYKRKLLWETYSRAFKKIDNQYEKILPEDIFYGLQREANNEEHRKKRKVELLMETYKVVGIILSLTAIIYFIYSTFEFKLNEGQFLSIVFAFVGVIITLLSFSITKLYKMRQSKSPERTANDDLRMLFISKWIELESISRRHLSPKYSSESEKIPITIILRDLKERQLLDDIDFSKFNYLLKMRNVIVHGNKEIRTHQILESIKEVDNLIDKLMSNAL